jgi:RHS repeat-associated protein
VSNLLNIANGDSSVSYTYDQLNRPVSTTQSFGGKAYTINYAYDAVGNRTSMTTPWGQYSYTYDALNRLADIINPQGITVAFNYDAMGRRTSKKIFKATPELLSETAYTYDAAGQLLSITNKAGAKVVAFDNYQYDANGNRVLKEDQDGTTKYGYDKSNRLITAEPVPFDMARAEGFIYDKNGNRRFDRGAKDYKYDAANRVLHNSVYTYTHDQNGNLSSRTEITSSATVTYAYTPEQQLSEVVTQKDRLTYKYDPLGRRTGRTVNNTTTHYVYDGQDIIAELDEAGNQINTYTNGPGIDEPLIMAKPDGKSYYYHADALGSITAITDDNRNVVETYTYKSYGQPMIREASGHVIEKSSIGNLRRFAAREYEPEIGLYNNRRRYLDPGRGAFTQEDPIGFSGLTFTLFDYVVNNPMGYIDPFGLDFITPEEGQLIANEASTWVGTPYVSPGNKKGVGADCSGAANQIYVNAGFKYVNTGSKGISSTAQFKPAPGNIPQIGDIGWWKGHVAIYDPRLDVDNLNIWTAFKPGRAYGKGNTDWWGSPTWYRYYKQDDKAMSMWQQIITKLKKMVK